MIRKLLLIGALPPPTGGDAIWAQNLVSHDEIRDLEIRTVNTSLIGKRAQRLGTRFSVWDEFRRACRIWWTTLIYLARFRPDVVHVNCNCSPFGVIRDYVTLCWIWMWGIPTVLHCHANVPDAIGSSRMGAAFLRRCLRVARRVLVLNASSAQYCNQLGDITSYIMPNFIDDSEVAVTHVIRPNIRRVIFVGHMVRTKGIFELMDVAKRFPSVTFVMAGMVTPEVVGLNTPSNMKFVGDLDKASLQAMLDDADVFLFPTHTEGFSMALLEAMARGLPVVTTSVGANADMIEGLGGTLVAVGNVESICAALQEMEDPAIRTSMSLWNIAKVKNNYAARQVIQSLKTVYGEVR